MRHLPILTGRMIRVGIPRPAGPIVRERLPDGGWSDWQAALAKIIIKDVRISTCPGIPDEGSNGPAALGSRDNPSWKGRGKLRLANTPHRATFDRCRRGASAKSMQPVLGAFETSPVR